MFWNARAFNQDIGSWDISSLTEASLMFKSNISVTLPTSQPPISWLKAVVTENILDISGQWHLRLTTFYTIWLLYVYKIYSILKIQNITYRNIVDVPQVKNAMPKGKNKNYLI
jgi:hypothetical protein